MKNGLRLVSPQELAHSMEETMKRFGDLLLYPDEIPYPRAFLHRKVPNIGIKSYHSNLKLRMVLLKLIGYAEVVVGMKVATAEEDATIKKRFNGGCHHSIFQNLRLV